MPIKTGYILPAANYASRLRDMKISMDNTQKQNIASVSLVEPTKVVVPSQLVAPATVFGATPIISRSVQLQDINATTPHSAYGTPATPQGAIIDPNLNIIQRVIQGRETPAIITELKNALLKEHKGLKSKEERRNLSDMSKEDVDISSKMVKEYIPQDPISKDIIEAKHKNQDEMSKEDINIKELNDDLQRAYDLSTAISNTTEFYTFDKLLRDNINLRIMKGMNRGSSPLFKIIIKDKDGKPVFKAINNKLLNISKSGPESITNAFDLMMSDNSKYLSMLKQNIDSEYTKRREKIMNGGSLVEGKFQRNSANFGSLALNEKLLKNGTLSIKKPFTNTYVVHEKTISPLLKKMIMDIANTLEFDKQDYHNLDGQEKRIIERIVRAQKDMKETNIKKLIDEDDYKMKKRLEILVGEINAGNASKRIINEMIELHKGLYDNGAITWRKYNNNIKELKKML